MKYIPNYIGTISKEDYEKVRELLTPILKKYLIGLRGRGRGSRKAGKVTRFNTFINDFFSYNPYHQSIPLEHSSLVGLYLRVEPTKQFVERYKSHYDQREYECVWSFLNMACPFIREEIRGILKENNIEVIRT